MSDIDQADPEILLDEPAKADAPDDPPAVPAVPADVVVEALGRMEHRLAENQRLIDRHADVAAKLHAENQVLREGELRKAQGALVLSVLSVLDDIGRMAATTEDPTGRNDLQIVAEALADALARNGVDALALAPGEPFDARRHKIATVQTTSDPAADRTIAAVLRPGFTWADGETVRVADVSVLKYAAPAEPVDATADDQPVAQ